MKNPIRNKRIAVRGITLWPRKDVAKQHRFGVSDFLSKEDYQTLKKYFVWEGEI